MSMTFSPTPTTVNTEVTATFNFKDNDVRAVYVDWADGESVKKEDANYQWIEITDSPNSTTATHTYNKSGSFYPVVQTINSNGLPSQYMSGFDHSASISPFERNTAMVNCVVNDAAPTALMRVENTTVNAGIDNSVFEVEGPRRLYITIAPTLTQAELNTIGQVVVEVEAVVNYNKLDSASGVEGQLGIGSDYSQEIVTSTIDTTTASGTQSGVVDVLSDAEINGAISKVLKVKYMSPKATGTTAANPGTDYTTNELFNRLKIFLVVKAGDGLYYPVAYVSAGMPVKSVEGYGRYITMDFSQSRTAASNLSIDNYRYDNGKGWFSPVNQWALSTDILGTGTKQPSGSSTRDVYYSYLTNPNGLNGNAGQTLFYSGTGAHWYYPPDPVSTSGSIRYDSIGLDDYGRIYDQWYDVRTSVVSASTSGSSIITNQPEVLLIKPTNVWTSPDAITQNVVSSYTTKMKNNGSTTSFPLSGLNSTTQSDVLGVPIEGAEKDYILLTFDSKTNKVFFNATNYANQLQSAGDGFTPSSMGLKIAGVEYLHIDNYTGSTQNAYWRPVEFTDTTRINREYRLTGSSDYKNYHTCFAKSGYVSFDMPLDWTAISIEDLCGGVYNTDPAVYADCVAAGNSDLTVTGARAIARDTTEDGYGAQVTITGASIETQLATLGTADEVGAWKYAFIVTTGNASGAMYWIASGGSNGWDGTTGMTLQYGASGGTASANYLKPTGTMTGSVRRINIYDVVNGASKVFSDTGEESAMEDVKLIPVGGDDYNTASSWFNNFYNCGYSSAITGSDWATTDKYVLKLTLSGATGAGTVDNPAPELWNIFDATQGDSALVKEMDDSAYSLNSLPITSDIRVSRAGQYFKAITRKGRVFIVKTGIAMQTVGFSSVALGDENSSTAFADHGPSTLYGYLHMIRKIQADSVPVYWDEPQKDGTFVRLWGIVTDINETYEASGPRRVVRYTFNMAIKEIALLTNTGSLMTDIFPLGGLEYERDYS